MYLKGRLHLTSYSNIIRATKLHHICKGIKGCYSNLCSKCFHSDTNQAWKRYGYHQDLRDFGGRDNIYISPDIYGPYRTTYRKVMKQLIAQFINDIYWTMVAILLHYCKFCKTLKLNRLNMNSHDPCVSNQSVDVL